MVDANPLISVLLGGAAVRVFVSGRIGEFAVAEHTLEEVRDFLPELARELGEEPDQLRLLSFRHELGQEMQVDKGRGEGHVPRPYGHPP